MDTGTLISLDSHEEEKTEQDSVRSLFPDNCDLDEGCLDEIAPSDTVCSLVDLPSPDSSIPAPASGSTDSVARISTETRAVGAMRAELKTLPPAPKEVLRNNIKGLNLSIGLLKRA